MVVFELSTGKRCMLGAASGENIYCVNLLGKVSDQIFTILLFYETEEPNADVRNFDV
jgi:hypothetical protein